MKIPSTSDWFGLLPPSEAAERFSLNWMMVRTRRGAINWEVSPKTCLTVGIR